MPVYRYRALNEAGSPVRGRLEAADEDEAYARLKRQQLSPFEIRPLSGGARLNLFSRKLSQRLTIRFVRQLSTLLSAGLPLLEAFDSLARSRASDELSRRARAIRKRLRGGGRLSSALEEVFPELPVYVVRLAELGEATGRVAPSLADAAARLEHEARMKAEIRSALAYPAFLVTIGSLIILLMFVFVVPRFDAMIEGHRDQVPLVSQMVIGFGTWFQEHWSLILIGFAGGLVAIATLGRRFALPARMSAALVHLPVLGRLIVDTEISRWARTVAIALRNGASMLDALMLGESASSLVPMRAELRLVRKAVRAGQPLDEALARSHFGFGEDVLDLIRTGRNSGTMPDMLLFVSEMHEAEAHERSKRLTSLIEPLTILFISAIVALIVISVVLAMTSIYEVGL